MRFLYLVGAVGLVNVSMRVWSGFSLWQYTLAAAIGVLAHLWKGGELVFPLGNALFSKK